MTILRKKSRPSSFGERDDLPATFLEAYQKGFAMLTQAGLLNAGNEAMWLMESGLGISRMAVYADQETPVSCEGWTDTLKMFHRRAAHEPLQYIMGTQEFRGLNVRVASGVFIPRPETELLVGEVIAHHDPRGSARIADIGTGSGCIALALAVEIPKIQVYAIDQSPTALDLAKQNAEQQMVQNCITFLEGDLVRPLYALRLEAGFSCIVSNPPYIPTGQLISLPLTVRGFEPLMALDGGVEGLDFYFRLLKETPCLLKPGGRLVMEMGEGQADLVCHEAERQGTFRVCRICNDSAGIARVVSLERVG